MDGSPDTGSSLDLVFLMDCTGSMGSYIASATQNIELICEEITRSEKLPSTEALRLAIVAYRDHPPQDVSYVTKTLPFTSAVPELKEFLKSLYASGGGDGPEAVTAAMKACLDLDWRQDSSKMVVLIADAPPHGIGEYGDGFAAGSPDGADPLQLARMMATQGIAFFVVACEPALSQYTYATDFFRALSQISAGLMLPLTNAALLARVIVGSALEHLDMERLVQEVGAAVAAKIHGNQESVDDVARELHERLMLRNESTKQLVIEDIYRDSPEARHNVEVWMNAPDLASAKPHVKKVSGSRFTDKYLENRYGQRSIYRRAPPVPARPGSTSTSATAETKSTPSPTPASSPSSPSRKIVSSFAAFSAPKQSLSATPMSSLPTQPTNSIFGAMPSSSSSTTSSPGYGAMRDSSSRGAFGVGRGGSMRDEDGMDDDDDGDAGFGSSAAAGNDEEDAEGVSLRHGGISLEQAKRITMQSAWRGLRA